MHKYMAMDRLLLLLSALSAVPLAESTLRASAAAAANRIMNDGGSADERASRDEHGGLLLDLFSWQNFLTVTDQTDAISSEAPTRSVRHDIDSTIVESFVAIITLLPLNDLPLCDRWLIQPTIDDKFAAVSRSSTEFQDLYLYFALNFLRSTILEQEPSSRLDPQSNSTAERHGEVFAEPTRLVSR